MRCTNHLLVERTAVCGAQTSCLSHERPCSAYKHANGGVRCINRLFVERTVVFGPQTTGSSCERTCAVHKLPVRRTNGRVQCINRLFVERTVVFGPQTTGRTAIAERCTALHKLHIATLVRMHTTKKNFLSNSPIENMSLYTYVKHKLFH